MGFIQEFKEFAVKGNMVDMAVGIIIGGAFGTVVKSLVDDLLMPPLGYLTGGVDFSDEKLTLGTDEPVDITWGNFVNNLIAFLIVAFAVFLLVKGINALRREEEEKPAAPPEPSDEVKLLTEIRDALQKG